MRLIELKCKNCGSILKVDANNTDVNCEFCHAKFKLDDEVKHIQYDNMEQSGYEFEKGRLKAQQEYLDSKTNHTRTTYVKKNYHKKKHGLLYFFFCLIFFPFVITYYVIKSEKLSKKNKIIILAILWGLFLYLGAISEKEQEELEKKPWASECTSINDFDYYFDGKEIILSGYKKNDKRIKICSIYEIDDEQYTVTTFSKSLFTSSNVYSVILPDTLKYMPDNTFNSSGIKYIYIPASLEANDLGYSFYKYFHNVEEINYGGSEEQWKTLTKNELRENIDSKNIIFNVKSESLN